MSDFKKIYTPGSWRVYNIKPSAPQRFPRGTSRRWRLRKALTVFVFVVALGLLGAGASGSVFLWYFSRGLPAPGQIIDRALAQSTRIYDRTGQNLLFEAHGSVKRTAIKLADVPAFARWATLAAEDRNFYKHGGFDLRGIGRALIVNLLRGEKLQGGSTITQQFIKNAVLSPEKTYTRKFRELVMAYKMEQTFSKDEILEMYFNEIPYGSTSYGLETAAQTLFGKSAKDLGLEESALLAALPKAPTYYSPYGSRQDELVARVHYILDEMAKEGHITREQADQAKKTDILTRIKPKRENITAPHFVMYARELLAEKYGERAVEQGGLKVITTIDLSKQQAAEKAIADNKNLINSFGASNAALVSLEAATGQILAMVGSLDYFDASIDGNVNVALRPRQPGSSFKPVVYAASFLGGYTPTTILYDVNTVFKTELGKDYEPKNYDEKEHGVVTVRQALAGSLNIPAVKMIYLTGINNVLDLAEKLGYATLGDRSRFGLSLVLGGGEVKLLEHANAFSVFARDGKYLPPVAILRVEDSSGRILEEWKSEEGALVFAPQLARQITSILSDNSARAFIFGAQNYLALPDRAVATKTGTTNDFRDAWAIGYTPELVTGVWVGNNRNKEMKKGADGSRLAAPIWNQFMREALKAVPPAAFTEPEALVTGKPILDGQAGAGITIKIDRLSGKLATEFTPPQTTIERTYKQTHDTLYYINKSDPRGPAPLNPADDPQFSNWESAVKRWAGEQGFIDEEPPRDFDDIHKGEDRPEITLLSPQNNETVGGGFSVSVEASSRRGVGGVRIYIDDVLVGAISSSPWSLVLALPDSVSSGFHALRATAFDDLENNSSAEVTINVLR